jgi:formate dehydrogenase (coenzyme F420) beta subunit
MSANGKINTHGDPLAALSGFLQALWDIESLDAMVVSPNGHGYLLEHSDELMGVNPFHPMMKANVACLLADTLKQRPGQRIGVILRACEMRAVKELARLDLISTNRLLTICVDCLGTYPVGEIKWREERLVGLTDITDEALRFAPQGGIAAYRYRPACQVCLNPGATEGMVNIGVIGLPVRKEMLVIWNGDGLHIDSLLDSEADEELVSKRKKVLSGINERHWRTREIMIEALESYIPGDIDALLDQLKACNGCQACLEACPICSVKSIRRRADGSLEKESLINWLSSCAGCGMCEQACPKELPLTAIFNRIRDQLATVN